MKTTCPYLSARMAAMILSLLSLVLVGSSRGNGSGSKVIVEAFTTSVTITRTGIYPNTGRAPQSSTKFLSTILRRRSFQTTPSAFAASVAVTSHHHSTSRPDDESIKKELLELVSATPSNAPTSKADTQRILQTIRQLELYCPYYHTDGGDDDENDVFLQNLSGNWELIWTAQDETSDEWNVLGPLRRWINPLENQSYSNNPLRQQQQEEGKTESFGRANPLLPRPIQDQLESMGVLETNALTVRSSQSIDIKKRLVRNVVTLKLPSKVTATLTVQIGFRPDPDDKRKIVVKFQSCRVRLSSNVDVTIPLGIVGPTGWLRTTYLDDTLRITRGHKGSVFVLTRPSSSTSSSSSLSTKAPK